MSGERRPSSLIPTIGTYMPPMIGIMPVDLPVNDRKCQTSTVTAPYRTQ